MKLAVIPARGGSKRIPRKNIKEFCGRPMIAWAIEVALKSGCFDRTIVSTDDAEVATIARQWGAEVPFVRPKILADDRTPTAPVIAHAICECEALGWEIDLTCCIYPCAPLLQASDLLAGLKQIQGSDYQYVFPIAEFCSPIQRAFKRDSVGYLAPYFPENELQRTQDMEAAYYDAGQFYWGRKESWLIRQNVHSCGYGLIIPKWRVVDIDTPEDWIRAEVIFKILDGISNV